MRKAAHHIRKQMAAAGAVVEFQEFQAGGQSYLNVLGRVGTESDERLVVGAHYDTCGAQPGADDNASGVAGLIELTRLLSTRVLSRRVDVVAYALEEPPYFGTPQMGSAHHARLLRAQGVTVRLMVALEMIGYFSDEPNSQHFPLDVLKRVYPTVGNFIAVVGRVREAILIRQLCQRMKRGVPTLPVHGLALPSLVTGVAWSDHRSYWTSGYPAVMVTDTSLFRNPNYHTSGDVIGTLDFTRMEATVRAVESAVFELTR